MITTVTLGYKERGRYHQPQKAAYWNGQTRAGEPAASGVYFYVLRASNSEKEVIDTGKMVILK